MKLSMLFLSAIIVRGFEGRNLQQAPCKRDKDCLNGKCDVGYPPVLFCSYEPDDDQNWKGTECKSAKDCGSNKGCFEGYCGAKDCSKDADCESKHCAVTTTVLKQRKCSTFPLIAENGIPEFMGYKSWRGTSEDYPKPLLRPVGKIGCADGYAWAGTFTFNNRLNIMNAFQNNKDIKLSVMDGSSCHKVIQEKEALKKGNCPYPASNKYSGNKNGKSKSGCDGGDPGRDIFEYAKQKGMVEDACMPYRCQGGGNGKDGCSVNKAHGKKGECASNVCTVRFDSMIQPRNGRFGTSKNGLSDKCTHGPNKGKKATVHTLLDWAPLDLKTYPPGPVREKAIIRALDDGPVTFGAKVGSPCNLLKFVKKKKTKKQIFTRNDQEGCTNKKQKNDIDLMLVGYGEEEGTKFWEVQGFGGTTLGDSGFFRIERDWALCNAGKDIAIPIVDAENWSPKDTSRSRRMQAAEDEDIPEAGEWQYIPDDSDAVLEASRHAAMAELTDECYQYVNTGAGSVIVDGDTARVRLGAVETFRFIERIDGGSGSCNKSSGEYQCTVVRDFMSEDPTNMWQFPDCIKIGDLPATCWQNKGGICAEMQLAAGYAGEGCYATEAQCVHVRDAAPATKKDGVIIALSVLTALFGLGCMVLTCYIMNMSKPGPTPPPPYPSPTPPNPSPSPPPHSYGNTEYALNQSAE